MTKDELLALLRLCNADPSAIDAVELAYELGFKAGQAEKSGFECPRCGHVCSQSIESGSLQTDWRNAAIRVGEELSSVGPDGYYNMTAEQWLDWALKQHPRGKDSLPIR